MTYRELIAFLQTEIAENQLDQQVVFIEEFEGELLIHVPNKQIVLEANPGNPDIISVGISWCGSIDGDSYLVEEENENQETT